VSGIIGVVERTLENKTMNVALHGWLEKMLLKFFEGFGFCYNEHHRKRHMLNGSKGNDLEFGVHKEE
jgi:hypothetical protein